MVVISIHVKLNFRSGTFVMHKLVPLELKFSLFFDPSVSSKVKQRLVASI